MTIDRLVIPEEPQQLEISGGEAHRFTFELEAEQFVTARVQQKGIDVLLRLVGTNGHVVEMDAPSGSWGREEISWVSNRSGPHRLEIIAPFPGVTSGAYELVTSTPRAATAEDREHSEAIRQLCLGDRARREGRNEDALPHYHQAKESWARLGKILWQLEARQRIGSTKDQLGDLPGARAEYLAARRLAESGDLLDERLVFTNLLTALYLHRSQPEEAKHFLDQATELVESTEHKGLQGAVDTNRALHHSLLGETDRALEIFIELTKRWDQPGRHLEQADAFHNLANTLTRKGRFVEAADANARAADAHRLGGNPGGWARATVALADARLRAGAPAATEKALEALFEKDARELVGSIWTALAHNSLGLARARLGKTEEALIELETTRSIAREIDDQRLEALARFNRGAILLRDDRPADALREFRAALETYEERSDSTRRAMAMLGIGQALKSLGRADEAIPHLEAALEAVESQRLGHSSWFFRMWFLASKQKYFEELIDAYMTLHELGKPSDGGLPFAERALRVAERRRARTFLDAISEQTLRRSAPHELVEREQAALQELQDAEAHLREARADDEKLEGSARRRAAMVELEAIRGQMHEASPVYADLTRPEPLGSHAILSELLDPQTRLLIYSLGEKKSYLWSLSQEQELQTLSLPGRKWIEGAARDALELVRTVSPEKSEERRAALARLTDLILGDLYDSMASERLVIVPDGVLELLPWAALRIPTRPPAGDEAAADRTYLVRHHEVTLLPSASSLAASRRGAARRPRASWEFAFVVDPVFSTFDDRAPHLSSGEAPEPAPAAEDLTRTIQSLGLGSFLERLPGTALEAEIITESIPSDLVYLATGFGARKGPELERYLQHSRVLHLATHGLVDREHPESSALALSQLDEQGARLDDAYLYAHEIFSLRVAAELVVLSACETGVGRDVPGEGIQGLARAFLYAGAPRVVMSLWQVDDIKTARLMGELYRQMLKEGIQPAAALQRAQLHLLDNAVPADDAPFYWAGFQHLGDWRDLSTPAASLDDSIAQETTGAGVAPPDGDDTGYPTELGLDSDRYSNGIDFATGAEIPYEEPSGQSPPADDLSFLGQASPVEMQWWIENHAVDDPNRQTIYQVDPEKLDEAGWAVAFTPGTPPEVKEALAPLLELRLEQAQERYRRIEIEPGWTSEDFRNRFEIGFGPADPEVLPYYVLLVGDPREIPFELQYGIDIQYAVGRLHFDQVEDYNSYALAVKKAERNPPSPREATIFGVDSGSASDVFLRRALVDPLTRTLRDWRTRAAVPFGVPVVRSRGDRKADFLHLLQNPPGFLFAAGHGLDCSKTPDGMLLVPSLQGALVCSDRNAEGLVSSASYFCGDDLPAASDLQGMITFLFACYGAGSPEHDDFAGPALGRSPRKIAPYPLVSHLAKRMLVHGAQAFVGHIDRAWSTSFSWHRKDGDQVKIFDSTCRQLLDGHRLGHAMEWFNQRFAEGSAELNQLMMVRSAFGPERASLLERMRKATFDARNYVVIGDPAVRLPGFGQL